MNSAEPTPEMVEFYERRTKEHIERVRRCLFVMAEATDYTEDLKERAGRTTSPNSNLKSSCHIFG